MVKTFIFKYINFLDNISIYLFNIKSSVDYRILNKTNVNNIFNAIRKVIIIPNLIKWSIIFLLFLLNK
jgi:hypothetical protein